MRIFFSLKIPCNIRGLSTLKYGFIREVINEGVVSVDKLAKRKLGHLLRIVHVFLGLAKI